MLGSTGPVETKVTAATAGAVVAAFVVWLLNSYAFPGGTPEAVVALVDLLVLAGGTFIAGFVARHTPRSDADARKV